MPRPRGIYGSAGSRIRVILGESGSDYLYYFDEDDGEKKWQSNNWTTADGGPPSYLCQQMNSIYAKHRHITDVAYDTSGQWFVEAEKRGGKGGHMWWGGGIDASGAGRVVLGPSSDYYDSDKCIILKGENGYRCSGEINSYLLSRMKRMKSKGKTIDCIRLFAIHGEADGYFISDDEGTEWANLGESLSRELKSGGKDPVLDVAVARDGSWIVFRPNRFLSSKGVSSKLERKISKFYRAHANRQKHSSQKIKAYERKLEFKRLRKEMAELQAMLEQEVRRIEAELQAKKEQEEAERRQQDEERKDKENNLKRRCDEIERFSQIQSKRLKPMERVTVAGFSSEPGDSIVKSVGEHGSVEIFKPLHQDEGILTINDPRLITAFQSMDDCSKKFMLFCFAADKYEAAVSIYHCVCNAGLCRCTRKFSGSFLPQSLLLDESGGDETLLPPPRPIIQSDKKVCFDEYKCAEKIDYCKLKTIVEDLAADSGKRKMALDNLRRQGYRNSTDDEHLKKLQRCNALEEVANKLESRLKTLPIDVTGCVVYQVEYEHRDPSGRGRLFAIGDQIKICDDEYPRTATVQGMQSDLRAAIVGKFAHDIDCENSEVRLICSLAKQLDLLDLIPTIIEYRDQRSWWLERISLSHSVSESEAKRLVNIILCGGRYETWLKRVGMTSEEVSTPRDIKRFYVNIYSEIAAVRDQLLQHPRFKWTKVEREKLQKEGRPNGTIDSALVPRIVQCCENEVLGIIHRTFHQQNWIVRAKIFDGLVVEPGTGATLGLVEVNGIAEETCRNLGWDIRLIEKSLHGTQDDTIETINSARAALRCL